VLKTSRLLPQIKDNAHNVQLFNSFCSQTKFTSSLINNQQSPTNTDPAASFNQHETSTNLYDWTNTTDPRHKLDVIITKARESINSLNDNNLWSEIEYDFELITNESNDKQIKEIRGITDRLCNLKGFLKECETCLARQKEVADVSKIITFKIFWITGNFLFVDLEIFSLKIQSFKQNQTSAKKCKDDTILQDLCNGHKNHLDILKANHLQILDRTQKIVRAKRELIKVIIFCLK
jgi:RB1-inducible coiled-coil protein 1